MSNELPDVHPLTDFRARAAQHLKRLRKADRPTILTQKGRAAAVLMSTAQYEQLLADAEFTRTVAAIQEALDDPRPGVPVDVAFARIRAGLRAKTKRQRRTA